MEMHVNVKFREQEVKYLIISPPKAWIFSILFNKFVYLNIKENW